MRREGLRRMAMPVAVVAVVLSVASCGSSGKHRAARRTATSTSTTATSTSVPGPATVGPTPTAVPQNPQHSTATTVAFAAPPTAPPSPGCSGGATLNLSDSDKGRTVSVHRCDRIVVSLGGNQWTFQGTSNSNVIQQNGGTTIDASECQGPGFGCGRSIGTFTAVGTGAAALTATRSSCGEGRTCTPDQGSYKVTVNVS